jgi:hypothetical protein
VYQSGDGDKGVAKCPFTFYEKWVNNPEVGAYNLESSCDPYLESTRFQPCAYNKVRNWFSKFALS